MDEQQLCQELSGFETVWRRVSAGNVGAQEQTLRRFIEDEICDAAYYTSLSRMFQGNGRAVLLSHAADEKVHARHLRAEYFIRTGVSYTPSGSCEPVSGKLASLRTALLHEISGEKAYRDAAEQTQSPELQAMYLSHADDEARHARENRALLLECF